MWHHVTMAAKFLAHNKGELKQRRRWRKQEWQKSNRIILLAKQQLCICIRLFCTFLSRHCKTATGNFLISRAHFLEYTTQKFSFSFSNLDTVLSDSNPETFANILKNEMKLNKINEVETVQTHFCKWCVWFVVIRKFCYLGDVTFMFYSVGFYIVYKNWSIWEFFT